MKQKSLLKVFFLLCALIVGSTSVWAEEASFTPSDFSGQGTSGSGSAISATVSNVTFACDKGYGTTQIRCYSGGKITISSPNTITAVSFTFSGSYTGGLETSYSGLSTTSWEKTLSSQARITVITVTYTPSSTPSSNVAFENTAYSLDLKDASSFTQTATTADGYAGTDGASVTYSMTANTAGATINSSTGEVTPTKAGSVTVQASAAAIAGKYSASSATYTLTVTDTRVFTVTCHTGDDSENIDRNSGATLSLDNPANKYGMSFVGWSSTNDTADPTWVANTTTVTENMELWAMYEAVAGEYSYRLVKANQADWRGDYLIAYSSDTFADGRVGKHDGTNPIGGSGVKVDPETNLSGEIVNVTWGDTYNVTFEAINAEDLSDGYVMKGKDNYYIYQTSNANGITSSQYKATAANYPLSIDFTSSSDIKIKPGGNASGAVFRYNTNGYFRFYKNGGPDPVYLYKRTEDVAPVYSLGISLGTEETVTIGSSKYASYCSSNSLDFSETDVKAYKAKVDEDKVVLTQVDYVPANTGVILYCATAKDYDVPVISNTAAVSDNEMVGVTVETTVVWNPSTDVYNYILQQGVFNKAAEAGAKLRANRAYLSTTYNVTAPGAKPLTIVFNDDEQGEETDGIKSVQGSRFTVNGEAYNLAGQRVGKDYKGIIVVNGKKIVK